MSRLQLTVAIDTEQTHRAWAGEIARYLREVAGKVEAAGGPVELKADWPDLESWHREVIP